jgi:AcrR family transcriptional regulator
MPGTESTLDRILLAARETFVSRGIRRTTVDDIATASGVSRVTVYRYFPTRDALVRAAFLRLAESLEALADESPPLSGRSLEAYLSRVGEEVMALPPGLPRSMTELERLHPTVHAEMRARLHGSIRHLFDYLYSVAEAEGRIRPGLDRRVIELLFFEVVTSFLDKAAVAEAGLTPASIYNTVAEVLLHGIVTN